MSCRAVYDTVVFFQWAALKPERQHSSQSMVEQGQVVLLQSTDLMREVKDVLSRPELRAKSLHMTPERVEAVLSFIQKHGEFLRQVPNVFTLPEHPDDDHLFNLAIAGKAKFLVTWENRLLKLSERDSEAAAKLQDLAPTLKVVDPPTFLQELRQELSQGDIAKAKARQREDELRKHREQDFEPEL